MEFVTYEQEGYVGIVTINRPKALNALNSAVLEELEATFKAVDLEATRCLILTGAGDKSFVAGADIGEMSTLTKAEGEAFGKKGNDVFRMIETFPIPVIAAVNGFALGGGCEISMSCDIRLCSDNAVFGQPEVGLGITPGFGGTQRLARLRTINPNGFVTAGNASGINDGAAAIVVMSEEKAKELGVKPMATWVAGALGGVDPSIMGIGPVASTKKVMAKTGLKIEDFDIIEANEAFAAQSVAVGKDLGIDVEKQLNPNGGAIALGHPVGASGCRILVTLLHEMQARGAKTGLATLCIGGGMGCSTVVKIED